MAGLSTDQNQARLAELLMKDGNIECCDCGTKGPEYASYNIGVFICHECAAIHRSLGTDVSRVKSLKPETWEPDQLKVLEKMGNLRARNLFEQHCPPYYRRPCKKDAQVLREEWIRAKYDRKEFRDPANQGAYACQYKEGRLMKQGRDNKAFQERRFVLSLEEKKLKYYNKENTQTPKGEINLDNDNINAVFVPEKVGNPNALQITFNKGGLDTTKTRCLYVYADNPKDVVDWFYAIRHAKLECKKIAFPDRKISELVGDLTNDFLMEGWLCKRGPRNEPYKRRWFTLDRRKMMYFEKPLEPSPIKEFLIGQNGFSVSAGIRNSKSLEDGFCFTLATPARDYALKADKGEDMEKWMTVIKRVIEEMPVTPQDTKLLSHANRKSLVT